MIYKIKGMPFRYKGAVDVSDCTTSEEVMTKSALDWKVEKCELMAKMPIENNININHNGLIVNDNNLVELDNNYAIYRKDYNIPLGVVKSKYTPVQNLDAFRFFDGAIGKDKAIWQTAGFFGNGERIFVSAKLPNNILVNGDPVENYLVFVNGHDGSSGVKILFTPIRVVCENTLNAAIRNCSNYVSFKHTKSVHDNIDMAKQILGICENQVSKLSIEYNRLSKLVVHDDKAQEAFAKLILTENEYNNIKETGHKLYQIFDRNYTAITDANISMRKVNILSEMQNYYFNGIGQSKIVGTGWGVYNAVTGYYSNVDNVEGIKRMDTLLFGDKARKIETIGNLLTT